MESIKLELNYRLEVMWEDGVYYCTVQEEFEGKPVISIPVKNGEYLTLKDGEILEAVYHNENYGVYGFIAKIEGRRIENNIPCYVLSKPFNVRKIQRREFVRVEIMEPTICTIHKNKENESKVKALLLDLSGGGARIRMKESLNEGDSLIISIEIDNVTIESVATIIRREPDVDKLHIYGLEFNDINDRLREKIIKKVFMQMRKLRELG